MIIYPDQNRLQFAIALRLVYFPFPWWTDRTSTCEDCEQARQRIAAAKFRKFWLARQAETLLEMRMASR